MRGRPTPHLGCWWLKCQEWDHPKLSARQWKAPNTKTNRAEETNPPNARGWVPAAPVSSPCNSRTAVDKAGPGGGGTADAARARCTVLCCTACCAMRVRGGGVLRCAALRCVVLCCAALCCALLRAVLHVQGRAGSATCRRRAAWRRPVRNTAHACSCCDGGALCCGVVWASCGGSLVGQASAAVLVSTIQPRTQHHAC